MTSETQQQRTFIWTNNRTHLQKQTNKRYLQVFEEIDILPPKMQQSFILHNIADFLDIEPWN